MDSHRLVWLASLKTLKRGKLKVAVGREALSPFVAQSLQHANCEVQSREDTMGGGVYALAAIRLVAVYHRMLKLMPHEREQLQFWEAIADADMEGHAFFSKCATSLRYQTLCVSNTYPIVNFGDC